MFLAEIPPKQLFEVLAAKHGHYCPMSTLGLRLGWAVRKCLVGRLESASYSAATCAADGIRLALETEVLGVADLGLHLLHWSDSTRHKWQIEMLPAALELAATYRTFNSDGERERLLDDLRSGDERTLFKVTAVGTDS